MRQFTEDQQTFRTAYRRFLAQEVVPHMPRWREDGMVGREAYRKAGESGFLMLWTDEIYGGISDRDFRFEQIIIEEIERAEVREFYAPLHGRLVGPPIDRLGTAQQKQRFLPACVRGECILAIAMTEPDAGSDLAGMRTHVHDMGDHFLLNVKVPKANVLGEPGKGFQYLMHGLAEERLIAATQNVALAHHAALSVAAKSCRRPWPSGWPDRRAR